MGYAKTSEDVNKAFPYGVKCVRDNKNTLELVHLTVGDDEEGVPVLKGFAPPYKDFYFDLNNVLVRKKDWLVFSKGERVSLRPLTEARGKQVESLVD